MPRDRGAIILETPKTVRNFAMYNKYAFACIYKHVRKIIAATAAVLWRTVTNSRFLNRNIKSSVLFILYLFICELCT